MTPAQLVSFTRALISEEFPSETALFERDANDLVDDLVRGKDIRKRYNDRSKGSFEFGPGELKEALNFVLMLWATYKMTKEFRSEFLTDKAKIAKDWASLLSNAGFNPSRANELASRHADQLQVYLKPPE